ncbi:hypothetical protein T440DRAFT_547866 [Plenodomus tracheiphilus IPT5]|uniref:DUF7730 domain-containing protein n=1 Tax=Plenodomus tracheiphilus IPT5 TaxID=1408161 RepID=A0A6A7BGQ7_9PLEO|nr:hypothetical protein T440DRAFT_547866 [Plenodomus tracheiphilus IPT5]
MSKPISDGPMTAWIDAQLQSRSRPASFLTLPREIRDMIYDYSLISRRDVLIIDSIEYGLPPAWAYDENKYMFQKEDFHVEHLRDRSFHASAVEISIALLRTCRQINKEASPIVYGKNTFMISVTRHRHNPAFRQLRTIVRWIESIGSQYKFLKKVYIDLGPTCNVECEFGKAKVDFVYFTKLIWARPEIKDCIEFVISNRAMPPILHGSSSTPYGDKAKEDLVRLDNIRRSLMVDDSLNLKRYAKFDRLISNILFDWTLQYGVVIFPSTHTTQHP